MSDAPDDIFTEEDEVIEVGGSTPPPQQAPVQQQQQPALAVSSGPPPSLRAEWDGQNRCWVALFQGDRQLEKWRPPTKAEWDALRERGIITRPSPIMRTGSNASLGQTAATTMVAEEPRTVFSVIKKNALPFGLGIGAAILGAKVLVPALKDALSDQPKSNPAKPGRREASAMIEDDLGDDMGDDVDG